MQFGMEEMETRKDPESCMQGNFCGPFLLWRGKQRWTPYMKYFRTGTIQRNSYLFFFVLPSLFYSLENPKGSNLIGSTSAKVSIARVGKKQSGKDGQRRQSLVVSGLSTSKPTLRPTRLFSPPLHIKRKQVKGIYARRVCSAAAFLPMLRTCSKGD